MFFIKSEKAKQVILEFMFPTMCIGAALALLIPTDGTEFDELRTYQYFMYHGYLVGFAVYLVMSKTILITWKTLFRNTAILFVFSIIAIYLNGIMQYAHTNFMFVSRPPIDGLPILNLKVGPEEFPATQPFKIIDENKRLIIITPYGSKYEELCEAVL